MCYLRCGVLAAVLLSAASCAGTIKVWDLPEPPALESSDTVQTK